MLGIGEATNGVIAPTILIDLFAREHRARLMSAYFLAIPIGSAIGISLGSIIASKLNWHLAFFLVRCAGPGRGALDPRSSRAGSGSERPGRHARAQN